MDKWKRGKSGVLVNDDVIGYENAKKRAILKARKKEETDMMLERIEQLERQVRHMDRTIKSLTELCRTMAMALPINSMQH